MAAAAAISSASRASTPLSDPPTTLPGRAPSLTPRVPQLQPGSPSIQLQSSLASAVPPSVRESSARRSANSLGNKTNIVSNVTISGREVTPKTNTKKRLSLITEDSQYDLDQSLPAANRTQ